MDSGPTELKQYQIVESENLGEKLLDRILPRWEGSEEVTRFAGLQPLYDGINLLDPVYCRKDEVLRMLEKCTGLNDSQQEQLTGAVMVFGYCEENGPESNAIEIN